MHNNMVLILFCTVIYLFINGIDLQRTPSLLRLRTNKRNVIINIQS